MPQHYTAINLLDKAIQAHVELYEESPRIIYVSSEVAVELLVGMSYLSPTYVKCKYVHRGDHFLYGMLICQVTWMCEHMIAVTRKP